MDEVGTAEKHVNPWLRRTGEPELVEIDPATDCLTQRLLDPDARPIPGASPAVMAEIRRRVFDSLASECVDEADDRSAG